MAHSQDVADAEDSAGFEFFAEHAPGALVQMPDRILGHFERD
jgi:hypothetical protein